MQARLQKELQSKLRLDRLYKQNDQKQSDVEGAEANSEAYFLLWKNRLAMHSIGSMLQPKQRHYILRLKVVRY